jgi:archaeosine-15-forming tRNA-guanine transglycosylase
MGLSLTEEDYVILKELGIDVFSESRRYWFIRTQGGLYYDSFVNEGYVGIEWDEISDNNLIKNCEEEELRLLVAKYYPKVDKPGYPVKQILKFANEIKKGDIVLIPNEKSQWLHIGQFLDDEMYIYEEEYDFEDILDAHYEGQEKKQILKKRRRVKWITSFKRNDWDPLLHRIIFSYGPVSCADDYSVYIDRMLSQFYIKGDEAFFTYKVNKKKNIPYSKMLKFLNDNDEIMQYINKYSQEIQVNAEQIILKISVQSKGPVQLKGAVKDVLIIGLIIGALFGTNMKFKIVGFEYSVQTNGLPGLINCVKELIESQNGEKDRENLIQKLNEDKEALQLTLPSESL